jgi:hypothetical protein
VFARVQTYTGWSKSNLTLDIPRVFSSVNPSVCHSVCVTETKPSRLINLYNPLFNASGILWYINVDSATYIVLK